MVRTRNYVADDDQKNRVTKGVSLIFIGAVCLC